MSIFLEKVAGILDLAGSCMGIHALPAVPEGVGKALQAREQKPRYSAGPGV